MEDGHFGDTSTRTTTEEFGPGTKANPALIAVLNEGDMLAREIPARMSFIMYLFFVAWQFTMF